MVEDNTRAGTQRRNIAGNRRDKTMISRAVLTVLLASLLARPIAAQAPEPGDQPPAQQKPDKVAEEAAQKAATQAAEIAATQAAEQAAEKAAERAVQKAAEEAAQKAAIQKERPDQWRGPTTVEFIVFVIDIDNINGAAQTFSANVFIALQWKDERLATDGWATRQMPLEEIWNPRVLLANEGGVVRTTMPRIVEVEPDGTVTYRQRYVGPLSQPLRLSDFPLDQHRFVIQFVAPGYHPYELKFVPSPVPEDPSLVGGGIADLLSLPDWNIIEHQILARPYEPVENLSVAGFAFEFTAKRYFLYYLWQLIVPLSVIVAMSWAAFWIDHTQTGAQIGVATSSVLTMIAYRFVVAGLLPRLPYMTRMDYFVLGSTLLVFLALVQVLLTFQLSRSNRRETARKIYLVSRVAFPAAFVLLLTGSLLV